MEAKIVRKMMELWFISDSEATLLVRSPWWDDNVARCPDTDEKILELAMEIGIMEELKNGNQLLLAGDCGEFVDLDEEFWYVDTVLDEDVQIVEIITDVEQT